MTAKIEETKKEVQKLLERTKKPTEKDIERLIDVKFQLIKSIYQLIRERAKMSETLEKEKAKVFYTWEELLSLKEIEEKVYLLDSYIELSRGCLEKIEFTLFLNLPSSPLTYSTKIGKYVVKVKDGVISQIIDIKE